MKTWIFVIIVIVVFIIVFYSYKLIPFEYTPNIPPLLDISARELQSLNEKLNKENLTEIEKQEILIRQEEIYSLLSEFFGKDIRNELV